MGLKRGNQLIMIKILSEYGIVVVILIVLGAVPAQGGRVKARMPN